MTVVVYTKDNCSWCVLAKQKLAEAGYDVVEKKFGVDFIKEDLQALLPHIERMTVPRIFIDGEHIGGYEELMKYLEKSNGTKG